MCTEPGPVSEVHFYVLGAYSPNQLNKNWSCKPFLHQRIHANKTIGDI